MTWRPERQYSSRGIRLLRNHALRVSICASIGLHFLALGGAGRQIRMAACWFSEITCWSFNFRMKTHKFGWATPTLSFHLLRNDSTWLLVRNSIGRWCIFHICLGILAPSFIHVSSRYSKKLFRFGYSAISLRVRLLFLNPKYAGKTSFKGKKQLTWSSS